MKKYISFTAIALLATIALSYAGPSKEAILAKENAAWQAFKDKDAAGFKKVVDKDIRCVYPDKISNLEKELADMKTSDIKTFAISDFDFFTDEPDVVVTTYTVKIEGTLGGQEASGTYNAGSVWKKEGNDWLAIFHTNILKAAPAK